MTTLRGIAQPSDCLLTHMLLAYWRKLLVCVRGVSAIPHIYTPVLQALGGWDPTGRLEGGLQGYRGGAMHDTESELPRTPIPRTPVNKEGRLQQETSHS